MIPSASLIPVNDPTVLFISAGMQPLVPYIMGEKHPLGKRLTDAQKCIRTDDIDEVGDACHHTFFEMLGNWSLGDYFKEDSIRWSYEFLTDTKWLGLDRDKLAFSVFEGDNDAPFDQISYDLWIELGVKSERIAKLPKKNNWWGPGETGPCGPDTEMFYWTGKEKAPTNFQETHEDSRWVEIWNNVFIEFNCLSGGKLEKLEQKTVDTGMGLERALAVINGFNDNYRTDLFWPVIQKIEELNGLGYIYGDKSDDEYIKSGDECWVDVRKQFRIIADHIKAATFAISDGVLPSNKGAGYIVRRLIRRAIVMGHKLQVDGNFITKIADEVFKIYEGIYYSSNASEKSDSSRQVSNNKEMVLRELEKEENKFSKTLQGGINQFDKWYSWNSSKDTKLIPGSVMFDLFQSYGFPLELTIEVAKDKGLTVSDEEIEQFNDLLNKHQELSRTASAGMFKGGLSDTGESTKKLHTAAHLLLESLRRVLGEHVYQKGSNITPERLRFDFSHPEKMTPEQLDEVEEMVNEQIKKDLPVTVEEMTVDEAKKQGAMGVFESKYGEKVKVYKIGDFSKEICGGPHASHTGELGYFKIQKEESSSAGVRRIKAILS